jgi:prohibitin 1
MAGGVDKALTRIAQYGMGIGIFGGAASQCLFNVDGGERVVILNMLSGVESTVRGEGTHFKIPWIMRPHWYDIKLRPHLVQTNTGTKDLQNVQMTVRMLFRPRVEGLPDLHKNYGRDYENRILPNVGQEVLKATVAQYDAEQLLVERELVSRVIRQGIVERAASFNVILDDVSITHLTYGKEFSKAIEEKQVAEQDAQRQQFIVQRSEQERQATVIRSEGEAEAAQMISDALKTHGAGLIEVRRIDAAKDIAESLSKSPNVLYLPANQQMLLNMAGGGGQRQQ